MRRIRIEPDPAYDKGGDATRHQSRMKVTARDGRVFEKDAPHRKGSPDFPMTDGERHAKFRRLAGAVMPAQEVERIIREVESLEQAPDVRALVELMQAAQE
jgi:2-methylcitrate dehydratase PrpD